jgi:hypothetical protein
VNAAVGLSEFEKLVQLEKQKKTGKFMACFYESQADFGASLKQSEAIMKTPSKVIVESNANFAKKGTKLMSSAVV